MMQPKRDPASDAETGEQVEETRSLLDQLLEESRLYTRGKDYQDLLDFVVRLRSFAPFNAMLLMIQKPGLSFAASAHDWKERFGRWPKRGARPLLILWPFGPVALVYDVMDTEGQALPEDVASFSARGPINATAIARFVRYLHTKHILVDLIDTGDWQAGSVRRVHESTGRQDPSRYGVEINQNHSPAVQFTTLAHELAHLALGHLGPDARLKVADRVSTHHESAEIEAESVAYLVAKRTAVECKSQKYLSGYVGTTTTTDSIDLYQVMRAAGLVETWLRLTAKMRFGSTSP